MTKQERRMNLALTLFAAAVFAGSILNWGVVALLVGAMVVVITIMCLIGIWVAMDDDWLQDRAWTATPIWKYVYDLVILVMLFAGSMSGVGILYAINYAMALYIKYRYWQVARIVGSNQLRKK